MAHASAAPTVTAPAGHAAPSARAAIHQAPVSPGKVAMWLFLATEVMFFTGLIGSYIVLRTGSPATAYSNLFPPGTPLADLMNTRGVRLVSPGPSADQAAEVLHQVTGISLEKARHAIEHGPGIITSRGLGRDDLDELLQKLRDVGATAEPVSLETHNWPKPYDTLTNPLSIDLTAFNTFVLICSSVTMVLALSGIQQGNQRKLIFYLLLTVLIGSFFLSIQVYEYYQLMFGHHFPVGISETGHFRPSVSLFGSCFFTMTGFHGAHVFGGVVCLTGLLIGSLLGRFTAEHHSPVELVGLYWHFVDLVWIILFTVVYLI
jgi:cytochrome c oxidase subunit III